MRNLISQQYGEIFINRFLVDYKIQYIRDLLPKSFNSTRNKLTTMFNSTIVLIKKEAV